MFAPLHPSPGVEKDAIAAGGAAATTAPAPKAPAAPAPATQHAVTGDALGIYWVYYNNLTATSMGIMMNHGFYRGIIAKWP